MIEMLWMLGNGTRTQNRFESFGGRSKLVCTSFVDYCKSYYCASYTVWNQPLLGSMKNMDHVQLNPTDYRYTYARTRLRTRRKISESAFPRNTLNRKSEVFRNGGQTFFRHQTLNRTVLLILRSPELSF